MWKQIGRTSADVVRVLQYSHNVGTNTFEGTFLVKVLTNVHTWPVTDEGAEMLPSVYTLSTWMISALLQKFGMDAKRA